MRLIITEGINAYKKGDEKLVARVEKLGHEVIAQTDTAEKTLEILGKDKKADICLIDMNLSGRVDGISLALQIKRMYDLPIILITSSSKDPIFNYAQALRPCSFLIKPFNSDELKLAFALVSNERAKQKEIIEALLQKEIKESPNKNTIYLREKDHYKRVAFKDILWAEAQSNYVKIKTAEQEFMLCITLQKFQEKLNSDFFERVHRSFLINLNKVDRVAGNRLFIEDKVIPVSKNRKEVFEHFKLL